MRIYKPAILIIVSIVMICYDQYYITIYIIFQYQEVSKDSSLSKNEKYSHMGVQIGAGDQNRTDAISLEG